MTALADDENSNVVPPVNPPAPPAPPPSNGTARPVVGHQGNEIPPERVSEIRLNERRKFLREHFGTDDENEVARIKQEREARVKKADELEAEREKKRLAEMDELTRTKEELRIEREKNANEKTKLERERDESRQLLESERQENLITGIGSRYVAPKFLKTAKIEFAEYVSGLTKSEIAALKQKDIDAWFKKYAKENGDFAIKAAAPAPASDDANKGGGAPAAPPPKRAPVGAPRLPGRPPPPKPPAGAAQPKKFKNMTREEWTKHWKDQGKKPPY